MRKEGGGGEIPQNIKKSVEHESITHLRLGFSVIFFLALLSLLSISAK